MKCNYCNSVWESKSMIMVCPFCGEELIAKENYSFADALSKIIEVYDINIINTPKVIGLLMDYCPKEMKKNELMRIFVNKGIGKGFIELHYEGNNSWEDIRNYCVNKMEEAFIGHEYASMIVDDIGYACGYSNNTKNNSIMVNNYDVNNTIADNCNERLIQTAIHEEIKNKDKKDDIDAFFEKLISSSNDTRNMQEESNDRSNVGKCIDECKSISSNGYYEEEKSEKIEYEEFVKRNVFPNGEVITKISIGGMSFKKFDIVTVGDEDEHYMCFAFCKFNKCCFILCERVDPNFQNCKNNDSKKYTKHFREYKIYMIDEEGYFNKVTDKTIISALLPLLDSSLKKSKGYQSLMKTFLPGLVSQEDIDAAEGGLRQFYNIL